MGVTEVTQQRTWERDPNCPDPLYLQPCPGSFTIPRGFQECGLEDRSLGPAGLYLQPLSSSSSLSSLSSAPTLMWEAEAPRPG